MRRALLLAPLGLVLLGACSGKGNDGQPERNFSWQETRADGSVVEHQLWDDIPWANHATPQIAEAGDGSVSISQEPVYPPIGTGMADPGSRPITDEDCAELAAIELSPFYVERFEPSPGTTQGVATAWSSYDDGTDTSFRTPGDIDWYPGLKAAGVYDPLASPWGLVADRLVGERPTCDGQPNDFALHYRGGRFNYYGGGFAHPLSPFADPCPPGSDFCSPNGNTFTAPEGEPAFAQSHQFWDLSAYDGLAFWARRGPEGGTSLLVGMQTKNTSEDLARENQVYCKRVKECVPRCVNGFECNDDGLGKERCMPEGYSVEKVSNPALRDFLFPKCGKSTCESSAHYIDRDFDGTECKPYEFTGQESGYWCYGEEPPPEPADRCGDGFVRSISVSTDWQLFKMPFASFRQVGLGKKAPTFDLKTVSTLFFQATVGYADVYVDNVSFYRNK